MDKSTLAHWRSMDAAETLQRLADYAKQDRTFHPRVRRLATRWNASVAGRDFEILCTGPKFFDTHSRQGGGGAIDMAMHLFRLDFKSAVRLLRDKGF